MIKSKNFIVDLVIAGGFIALGVFVPGSTLTDANGFAANIAGVSTGLGIGWIVKTFIDYKKGVQIESNK
ncbi:MAG: hypothetical protein Q8O64_19615 [Sideroxyarcus sp.]|nr:hypothetical protein [Sideroxyarcus sp.]